MKKSQKTDSSVLQKGKKGRNMYFRVERLPILVTVLIVCYLLFSVGGQLTKLYKMETEVRSIEQEVSVLQTRNNQLTNELDLIKSKAYVEEMARNRLGLVKPGESPVVTEQNNK